jgi:glucokinase
MTLDAGGTNFRFSAVRAHKPVTRDGLIAFQWRQLDRCLANIVEGFARVKKLCPKPPVAISFAFPGPVDYPNGIVGDLGNLPGFRGGVALGPMLEEKFGLPVFMNNDGDLFVYGEAIAGFLPHVNSLLKKAGSPKRYNNLFGVTLGTGFGGGFVRNGELFVGDNSSAGEVWLMRNKLQPHTNAEEGASIRAVRRVYAEKAGLPFQHAPEPKVIYDIGQGKAPGHKAAALEAYRQLGEVVGDALGNALTLVDGLAVVGGGLSGAAPLFLPALTAELNGTYIGPDGVPFPRLGSRAFNLEDPAQLKKFLAGATRVVTVPIRPMNRREFIRNTSLLASTAMLGSVAGAADTDFRSCGWPEAKRRFKSAGGRAHHRARQIVHRQQGIGLDVRELFSQHPGHDGRF